MWICLNRAFLSVVQYRPHAEPGLARALAVDPADDLMLVRARREGHLQYVTDRYAPEFRFQYRPGHDYAWGGLMPRARFAEVLAAAATDIDYSNFKDSVDDHGLHRAYAQVWGVISRLQQHRRGGPGRGQQTLDLNSAR